MVITQQEILTSGLHWYNAGEKFVLATVINTKGSSPQPVASILIIREDGHCLGSVSSGCVEGSIIESALSLMEKNSKGYEILSFGSEQSSPFQTALTCGGDIEILLEFINKEQKADIIRKKIAALENGNQSIILTNLQNGQKSFYENSKKFIQSHPNLNHKNFSHSSLLKEKEASYFMEVLLLKPKLFLIGAVHICLLYTSDAADD